MGDGMEILSYGQVELDHLKERDAALGAVIDRIGMIECDIVPDLFVALVNSIVCQQLSGKAADTVWNRMRESFGDITPHSMAAAPLEDLRACGLSQRKAEYVRGIAKAVETGEMDIAALPGLPDEEVIMQLSSLRGVGIWTAEMLLIFSMGRPDVVSYGDLAIRRGMMRLYGLEELDRETFESYRRQYSPYGTVASLYLWKLSHE
jgi:DNA-3-methyladenine glycosylase II